MPTSSTSATSYIYKIVRTREDSLYTSDLVHITDDSLTYDSYTLLSEEQVSTPINTYISQKDQYGLWFNATYKYTIFGRNIITGEEVSSSTTISTKPFYPINFSQVIDLNYGYDIESYIQLSWENHEGTGDANTNSYYIQRTGYQVTDSVTYGSILGSSGTITVSDILSYQDDISSYLYGKVYFTYKIRNTNNSNWVSSSTVTVSDFNEAALSVTVTAHQNPIDVEDYTSDSFGNSLSTSSNYLKFTLLTTINLVTELFLPIIKYLKNII